MSNVSPEKHYFEIEEFRKRVIDIDICPEGALRFDDIGRNIVIFGGYFDATPTEAVNECISRINRNGSLKLF